MTDFYNFEKENLDGWRNFPIRVGNKIKHTWRTNKTIDYLRRHRLKRVQITSYVLIGTMVWAMSTSFFSPKRVTYTESQLLATQVFNNGVGSITAKTMTYSPSNGIVVMELSTSDATSNIVKGINVDNLEWQVFLPSNISNPQAVTLEVIPLTGNKVYLVMRNVPTDYGLMVIRATNNTPNSNGVKIEVQEYEDYLASSDSITAKVQKRDQDKRDGTNFVDFFITPQNELLKNKFVKNLSRENFALKIFNEELKYQRDQKKSLENAAETLDKSIEEDNATLEQLNREAEYLVGNELLNNQEDIEAVQRGIETKAKNAETARENAAYVQTIVEQLEKNIEAVKNGTYKFNSPVRSISQDIAH